jgi:signal transduction histidine kinase/CheY-like chemotaxis protein
MELKTPNQIVHHRAAIVREAGQHVIDVLTAATFAEALNSLALRTRLAVGAHQCAISYLPGGDFSAAIHATSFTDKYRQYESYDVMPTGGGIWGMVVRQKNAVRMTEQELLSHPMWKNFSDLRDARGLEHPPMRGWLAAPVLAATGEILGVLQLSDKCEDADFTSQDLELLIHLAHMVSPTFQLQHANEELSKRTEELHRLSTELEQRVRDRTAETMHLANDLQAILQAFPDLYFWMEHDGTIRRFHAGMLPYVASDEFINRRVQDIIPAEVGHLVTDAIQKAVHTQTITEANYSLSMSDGEHWFSARFVALTESKQVLACVRDESARVRAEQERRKLEAQFQHAQKLESLGILAGGIAHDFNNLLTSILGFTELAKLELPPDSAAQSHLDDAVKSAQRAAELTHQMLAYSGKGRFVIQSLSLSAVVEDMARLLEVSISKKCVLQYHFTPNLPALEADTAQLRQVIMNLIINASEASGDRGGVIAISTGVMHCDRVYLSETKLDDNLPEGLYVYLEVADTGCGMSKETLAKIFDPFFTTKFTGRGLGLAAVLGIVRGHHGAIKVCSELGKGTSFKVLLPATTDPAQLDPARSDEVSAWRGSGLVLIVDDEEPVRRLTRRMMEMMGFTVLTAADGREGVELFRKESERIRLVLLDMTMPYLDGEQAFDEMRRIRTGVPTVLCSGFNEQTATNRFADKGLAAFIQKPYQYQQLMAVVRKALMAETEPIQTLQQTDGA